MVKRAAQHEQRVFRLPSARRSPKLLLPLGGGSTEKSDRWLEGSVTAEVAIMNKLGIALAADSTVSIGDKTYDSANKLFALSKHHPVGILVYNTMDMTTVPMEILIKGYRDQLKLTSHKTLAKYSNEFIRFLTEKTPVGKEEEKDNVTQIIRDICLKLNEIVSDKCDDSSIDQDDPKNSDAVKKTLFDEFDRLDSRATEVGRFEGFSATDESNISRDYGALIKGQVRRHFRHYKLSPGKAATVERLLIKVIVSNLSSRDYTGFVVAGYGDAEHYPSIIPSQTDGFIVGKLKIVHGEVGSISHKNKSIIYPFAQSDIVQLFVEGAAKTYQRYIERGVQDIFADLAATTAKYFGVSDSKKISRLRSKLRDKSAELLSGFGEYSHREFVKPMLDAIKYLDKAELALLAESLVNITALKRKISLDVETVGGPIDVAVISKGDGFIWIKRKHYFDPTLNPFYFQKYLSYRGTEIPGQPLERDKP